MQADYSFIGLIMGASPVVKVVMVLLLLASIVSWNHILRKAAVIKLARRAADEFEKRFWSGSDLNDIYRSVVQRRDPATGMENIFEAGFKEFARLRKQSNAKPMEVLEGSQRAMRVSLARELDELDTHLSFLATVGSTSPYVGLFGTVWGIMNSFRSLGSVEHATLALVAPGIAEALIATAMGLFAAIPAVIAYNRFANDVERLDSRYDTFMEEFSSILHRHAQE
ncbi:MAG TPA: protein TolQ [Gammaproteobacteria bacterium]|nr:protein TolQ [Gammaproteobacteria bacterium]